MAKVRTCKSANLTLVALHFIIASASILAPSSAAEAVELFGRSARPNDWSRTDRVYFEKLAGNLTLAQLRVLDLSRNSFVAAARYNTRNYLPDQYRTVGERHAYYNWASLELAQAAGPSDGLRSVHFFDATTVVTSRIAGLGILDASLKLSIYRIFDFVNHSDMSVLKRINEDLFSVNLEMARRLLYVWKEPRDPEDAKATARISALDFDQRMVFLEQSRVRELLKGRGLTKEGTKSLSRALAAGLTFRRMVLDVPSMLAGVGIDVTLFPSGDTSLAESFDFGVLRHRVAVGLAYVYHFHNLPRTNYAQFVNESYPRTSDSR